MGLRVGHKGSRMARTHVVLSDETLARLDDAAGKRGRSRFIEEAVKERLDREEMLRVLEETAGTMKDNPAWSSLEDVKRWVRRMRGHED